MNTMLERLVQVLQQRSPRPGDSMELQRAQFEQLAGQAAPVPGVDVAAISLAGLNAERLTPRESDPSRTLLWLHGGGYVMGSLDTVRPLASRLACAIGAPVLTLDYRLAPVHPHPAALDDAVAAYHALVGEGYSPSRLAIGGDSAGGGLAVASLVALRNEGARLPAAGVCLSPWVDLTMTAASYDAPTAFDPQAPRWQLTEMARCYLAGADPATPSASPRFADLTGLPSLLIHVGGAEKLLDDATALAGMARAAGVDVTLECPQDMLHVWHAFAPKLPEAVAAIERVGRWLRARWAQQ